ncbi:hypothetical protein BC829DRAFT_421499 [Chytridium lagenaria]|nr:hypothetical protein BC829DRAFT_421499 [Chytridium lagenaria]
MKANPSFPAPTSLRLFGLAGSQDATSETIRLKSLLTSFEQANSVAVAVDLVNLPEDEYRAELKRRLDTDSADVYIVEHSWAASFETYFANLFDIDGLAPLSAQLEGQIKEAKELNRNGEKLIAAPFWADFGVLYYRTDILSSLGVSSPPRTWTEVQTICTDYISRNSQNNGCFLTAFRNQSALYAASEWLFTSSDQPLVLGGLTFNFNDTNVAEILARIKEWSYTGIINRDSINYSYDQAADEWVRGNGVFFQGRASHYQRSSTASQLNGRWNVTTIPGRTNTMSASSISGYHLAIAEKSQNKQLGLCKEIALLLLGIPSAWSSYVGSNNATLCTDRIPLHSPPLHLQQQPNCRPPRSKVGSLWLTLSDSLIRDLRAFFNNRTMSAAEGLAAAATNIQNLLSSVPTRPSTTTTRSTTAAPSPSLESAPSTATPVVMIISGIVAGIVAIAIVVAILIIQKPSPGKYVWEAAATPQTTTMLQSQTSKSYAFSSDYDSVTRGGTLQHRDTNMTPSVVGSDGYRREESVRGGAVPIVESMGKRHAVVYPFEPTQMDEMPLRAGDKVLLKTAYDDGYAFGEMETPEGLRSGVFPLACLIPTAVHSATLSSPRSPAQAPPPPSPPSPPSPLTSITPPPSPAPPPPLAVK